MEELFAMYQVYQSVSVAEDDHLLEEWVHEMLGEEELVFE